MPTHPYSQYLQRAKLLAEKGQLRAAQTLLQENFPDDPEELPPNLLEAAHALEEDLLKKHLCYQALLQAEEACLQTLSKKN